VTPAGAAFLVVLIIVTSGCSGPLPEAGSADAQLYEARCGTCHRASQPHTLTPAMWRVQVDRMDKKYREAGMTPPTSAERERIVAYLVRNAGG
jgi:hypothetical protein